MDIFKFHKLALEPILGHSHGEIPKEILLLSTADKEKLVAFIIGNGLGPLWHKLLKKNNVATLFSEEQVKRFEEVAMVVVAQYLMQKFILGMVVNIFEKELITYAIFKGAHLREILYREPAVRSAADIDILVHPFNIEKAAKVLVDAGFRLEVKQQNISHEITLYFNRVAIDLHWHILRPGRLRMSLTDEFLAKRYDYTSHIGFDSETTLFIMLVHPVFTKYSTTSLASLVRFVDLHEWIKQRSIDWSSLLLLLQKYGVCTAAWVTATYLQEVTGKTLPDSFLQKIKPSLLKRWYLKNWIITDRASKFLSKPFLIQLGLTLPAHDTIADAIRFITILAGERRQAGSRTKELLAALAVNPES